MTYKKMRIQHQKEVKAGARLLAMAPGIRVRIWESEGVGEDYERLEGLNKSSHKEKDGVIRDVYVEYWGDGSDKVIISVRRLGDECHAMEVNIHDRFKRLNPV